MVAHLLTASRAPGSALVVYFCDYDYCDVAAWTDICENSDRSYVSVLYVKSLILKSSVVNRHYRFFRTDEQSVSACTDKKAGTNHENAIAGNLK